MKKNNNAKCIPYLLTGIAAIICLFLPSILMNREVEKTLHTATAAPSGSYMSSSVAMSRYISNQLSAYERIQLISGGWDSTCLSADWNETDVNEAASIEAIKTNLNTICHNDKYELHFDSSYENWYTWETSLYKAVDASFSTYLAYYTISKFTRYDNAYAYYVIAAENGDILYIYTDYTNLPVYETVFAHYRASYASAISEASANRTPLSGAETTEGQTAGYSVSIKEADFSSYLFIPVE